MSEYIYKSGEKDQDIFFEMQLLNGNIAALGVGVKRTTANLIEELLRDPNRDEREIKKIVEDYGHELIAA
ncbi:hypothetical protein [Sulfuracidifex tepidarius]|uniref:Uncharacterized protein n=1 Tax=Sulfuracidifex tepidarius TaxID=1294262 RepID=A0A510E778_9CREN|nr:hypothetical protein [Sulfuracidifex tepidarius]BBG28000.1 hypothetical protein IC007_2555 [Sulfuracidifex tepidarius]